MYEKILNCCTGVVLTLAIAGVLFPRQASSVVLTVFPPAEWPDIDKDGNPRSSRDPLARYLNLIGLNQRLRQDSMNALRSDWRPKEVGLLLETLPFVQLATTKAEIYALLRTNTKESLPDQETAWREWFRDSGIPEDPRSGRLKSILYGKFSPPAGRYFDSQGPARIRLDVVEAEKLPEEMRLLANPVWKSGSDAKQLEDAAEVFGIEYRGVAYAFPQALVSNWDGIRDSESGREFFLLYDVANGAATCFQTKAEWGAPALVNSGFRYGQYLLMGDDATESLWLGDTGEAVTGQMASQQRKMEPLPVTKVDWKTWLALHPETLVLANAPPPPPKDAE